MNDEIRPNKWPVDDPKKLKTELPADGDESDLDGTPEFALQAVDPPQETASGFTRRHPYGITRRSTHIF